MGTIADKLNKLVQTKAGIKAAIIAKGQTVGDADTFASYAGKITAIQTGVDTSDATAVAGDIASGKTAYVKGKKVSGTAEIQKIYWVSIINNLDEMIYANSFGEYGSLGGISAKSRTRCPFAIGATVCIMYPSSHYGAPVYSGHFQFMRRQDDSSDILEVVLFQNAEGDPTITVGKT